MELLRDLFVKYFFFIFIFWGLAQMFFYIPFFKKIRDLRQRYNLPAEKSTDKNRSNFFTSKATKELMSRNFDFAQEVTTLKRRYYGYIAMTLIIVIPMMLTYSFLS